MSKYRLFHLVLWRLTLVSFDYFFLKYFNCSSLCLVSEMEDGNRSGAASSSKSHSASLHLQSTLLNHFQSVSLGWRSNFFNEQVAHIFPFSSKKWRRLWSCHPIWREQLWTAGILYPEWSELWRWVYSFGPDADVMLWSHEAALSFLFEVKVPTTVTSPKGGLRPGIIWWSNLIQIPLRPLACPPSTTPSWWWPTCGLSCRSLRKRTCGCRRELRTWKRRGTSCAVSLIASSSQRRARATNRIRASTVMVRSACAINWKIKSFWNKLFFF